MEFYECRKREGGEFSFLNILDYQSFMTREMTNETLLDISC
jgi:hypothetical protein